jgi:hypothetical protein
LIFDFKTFKRVVLEGFEAYQQKGPYRVNPYGRDPRNGAWSFGALQAKRGFSRNQAWANFVEQESRPQVTPLLDEQPYSEPVAIEEDTPPPELIPTKSRHYFH